LAVAVHADLTIGEVVEGRATRVALTNAGLIIPQASPASSSLPEPKSEFIAERFVLSIKKECLDKLVPPGEHHLRLAISEFVAHYHLERNHQGLDNRLLTAIIAPANDDADPAAPIGSVAS
jgi:hypothetical protein